MSNINPIQAPYPASITGLDLKIQEINAKLATLPWLTKIFNRAWTLPEVRDDGFYRQPRIYSGEREYWNVMPNDEQQAFSFMIGVGPATMISDEPQPLMTPILWNKRLDLIFFLDLSKIEPTKDYPYTEELNSQIIHALGGVSGVVLNTVWMEDIRDVYEGFDLSEIERDYLYYPFSGIRYELDVSYYLGDDSNGNPAICN